MLSDFKDIAFKVLLAFIVIFIVAKFGYAIGQLLHEFMNGLHGMAAGAQGG